MKKYHILFADRLGGRLAEYETDIEPPIMGDIIRLDHLTDGQNKNTYVVYDRWYTPVSENQVDVTFTLDLYDNDTLH
jgi:hypothetical protein